jgi:hypothetical protein
VGRDGVGKRGGAGVDRAQSEPLVRGDYGLRVDGSSSVTLRIGEEKVESTAGAHKSCHPCGERRLVSGRGGTQ